MKLKTLKDIKKLFEEEDGYDYNDYLKAEVIRWINSDMRDDRNWREMFEDFFNITEEDLK